MHAANFLLSFNVIQLIQCNRWNCDLVRAFGRLANIASKIGLTNIINIIKEAVLLEKTFCCLCTASRRFKRQHQRSESLMSSQRSCIKYFSLGEIEEPDQ